MKDEIVGVISDTHGLFEPKLPTVFASVSHIVHAGDIGHLHILEQLSRIAPVTAVSGNIDEGVLPPGFDPAREFCLFGIRIFMAHILGNPQRLSRPLLDKIERIRPDVVIFGHSHKTLLETHNGVLYFNPGSAGPRRFSLPRSVGLLRIQQRRCHGEIVYL
jgi:putative phosphoesterase